ncbi:branched-chain amino acid ABC transporter permease [Candidatus Acetothermia bacterium]|jgi:branched-chain amino acid transport system permease protein|nr:branched-chain amino acid ABC transporter permease [Candidatus Acetothermia bacterium]MCI2431683.1 branched-chain amino acid ABC transporter permease [Candidatus Acetothermia bacterium]MCI2436399.1 branched-chain amino acid ABC transporter permease [Candidatus Acetothermia bacterium]
MAQIMALSMMVTALAGLALLLTRRRARDRWVTVAAILALFGTVLGIAGAVGVEPVRMVSYLVNFVILAGLYALLALGLNVQWGYTGLFNIGVAGFFGLGAYLSTILVQNPKNLEVTPGLAGFFATYYNLPFPLGLLGAMLASGVLALIVGVATLRLRTDYLAIATIGIAEILRIIVTNERTLTEGTRGIPNIPQPLYECLVRQVVPKPLCELLGMQIPQFIEPAYYNWFYVLIVIGLLALGLLAIEGIARSPWGRVLRAVREDEEATNALGKNVFAFKLQSLIVGAMIMGAAGSLWAHFVKFVDPQIFDPVTGTFLVWVMLIVGGTGNNRGAILGAFIMWGIWSATNFLNDILPPILDTPLGKINVAAQLFGPIRIISIAIMLELILLFRPRGLLGEEKITSTFASASDLKK